MKGIQQFFIILAANFFGEILRYVIPLSIPAGIYGLVVLFFLLCTGVVTLEKVEGAADGLIEIMSLFFIPAGVKLMTRWSELKNMFVPFLASVIGITVLVMLVTGTVTQFFIQCQKKWQTKEEAK